MSFSEIINGQVSTRFMLSMVALVGTFAYGWIGPLAYQGGTAGDVLNTIVKIVMIYVTGQTIKHGIEHIRK